MPVGFGTSAPELVVSVQSAVVGYPDLALGNVVGSNIASILLIIGFTALVAPIRLDGGVGWREAATVLAATVIATTLALFDEFTVWHGAIMLAALAHYLFVARRQDAPTDTEMADDEEHAIGTTRAAIYALGGWCSWWSARTCWSRARWIPRACSASARWRSA